MNPYSSKELCWFSYVAVLGFLNKGDFSRHANVEGGMVLWTCKKNLLKIGYYFIQYIHYSFSSLYSFQLPLSLLSLRSTLLSLPFQKCVCLQETQVKKSRPLRNLDSEKNNVFPGKFTTNWLCNTKWSALKTYTYK